jgi:methionyl-tRNA formyltransferase
VRVALLTLEALASAAPVRRFVAEHAKRIACVALSDPYRPQQGGMFGQANRLLQRSGPRLFPYLTANFSLPRLAGLLPIRADTPERTPMVRLCSRFGIPVREKADMNAPDFRTWLKASEADILLTFHCDQILTEATIGCLPFGALNVHPGLLPDHRGPVPTIHALMSDPPRFGVTVHRTVARIDAGPILAQTAVALPAGTSALTAAIRLHAAAIPLVIEVLDSLAAGTATERMVEPRAYCGFPTGAQLRDLARSRRRIASVHDIVNALRTPV